ncbi:hypothetical protein EVAR_63919_1 [Eumeta japonica]|uniref:Uncharacterized protein n=1 Tax=Eumeta variegata TaxID=151549 RepID=A0A4C1ZGZ1_EUMVA|nr:hypothetical protein EVAR_63919_1 [Eumeta japonica]
MYRKISAYTLIKYTIVALNPGRSFRIRRCCRQSRVGSTGDPRRVSMYVRQCLRDSCDCRGVPLNASKFIFYFEIWKLSGKHTCGRRAALMKAAAARRGARACLSGCGRGGRPRGRDSVTRACCTRLRVPGSKEDMFVSKTELASPPAPLFPTSRERERDRLVTPL